MIGALLKHRKNVILYCYIVLSCLKLYDIAKTLYFNRNKLHENSYIYIVILLYMLLYLSIVMLLGRSQDLTKGGSDKRPPKAVAPRGVWRHAPPKNFYF